MSNLHVNFQKPVNEPILSYAPKSIERDLLTKAIINLKSARKNIPMIINGKKITTKSKISITPPHDKNYILGHFYQGGKKQVEDAIETALKAKEKWENLPWETRGNIFLKAADLIASKYRFVINAATMLGQGKNCYQAEIDSACELIDFLRFNVYFLNEIYQQQPLSVAQYHNRLEYRPLEGFVLAITPFNFTAIGGNLPSVAAMCGNVVVWKPADTQIYSASIFMQILIEAGLPPGVINMVFAPGEIVSKICLNHNYFAGLHFTGSTKIFNFFWQEIAKNISKYVSYPRIVGETGGKDFVLVHPSADINVVVSALIRGAFEFQGQKCSAASRAYIPKSLAQNIFSTLCKKLSTIKMGSPEDYTNFVNAVIDEKSFSKIVSYIEYSQKQKTDKILFGGKYDKTVGYFIEPTVIITSNPSSKLLQEEIFGPVLTLYVYNDNQFEETCELINNTSPYALTGAIISQDIYSTKLAQSKLKYAAGNLYINDKPTGAVVGQQPFGGGRVSGTNDKAGSMLNLYRWLSPRTIRETFNPATNYEYPFLEK